MMDSLHSWCAPLPDPPLGSTTDRSPSPPVCACRNQLATLPGLPPSWFRDDGFSLPGCFCMLLFEGGAVEEGAPFWGAQSPVASVLVYPSKFIC